MKTLLVPFDFSEESQNALYVAQQLAQKAKSEIILLHVFEDLLEQSFSVEGEMELEGTTFEDIYFLELVRKTKRKLQSLTENEFGLSIKVKIRLGNIYKQISQLIDDEKIDLVVMGSRGASGLEEVLVGSNTEKVVRYAKCPVLTVKNRVELSNLKKIVFASDLIGDQGGIVQELKDLVKLLDVELIIVKINLFHRWVPDDDLMKDLSDFAKMKGMTDAKLEVFHDTYLEDGIINFAEKEGADIIALGTHGRTGLAHIIAGSVAENMANHANRLTWTCSY